MARGGWGGKAAGNCQVVSRPTSLCCAQLIKATSVLDRPPPQGEGGGTETACVGVRAWSVCVRRQRKGEVGVGERKRTKMVVDAGLIPSSRLPLKSQPVRSTVLSMHMTDLVSISTDPPPHPNHKQRTPSTHTHTCALLFFPGFYLEMDGSPAPVQPGCLLPDAPCTPGSRLFLLSFDFAPRSSWRAN